MRRIKSLVVVVIIVLCCMCPRIKADDNHYFKGDLWSGNIVTFMANMGITTLINKKTGQFTYDNIVSLNNAGEYCFNFSWRALMAGFGTGVKVGYRTDNTSMLNFTGYGSLHYRISLRDFETKVGDELVRKYENTIHKMQIGTGGNVIIGNNRSYARVIVDAGLRYNIPFAKATDLPEASLNSGVSGMFGLIVAGGRHWMKKFGLQIGLWFEYSFYDMYKKNDLFDAKGIRDHAAGMNMTWCPWR